jgi:hypothetical protein
MIDRQPIGLANRLIVFPLVLGEGTRVFPDGAAPVSLALVSAQTVGPAVRLIYARDTGSGGVRSSSRPR